MTFLEKLTRAFDWADAQQAATPQYGDEIQAAAIRSLWGMIEPLGVHEVLEVACGKLPSPFSQLMDEHGISAVYLDRMIGLGVSGVTLGDVHDLPFGDEQFDLVVSRQGPEHFLIPALALMELARVSRRWLLIVVPDDNPRCPESPGHVSVFGRTGWLNLFRRLGLREVAYEMRDITAEENWPQTEWRWLLERPAGWRI